MFHEQDPGNSNTPTESPVGVHGEGYRLSFIHRFPAEFSAVDGPEDGKGTADLVNCETWSPAFLSEVFRAK